MDKNQRELWMYKAPKAHMLFKGLQLYFLYLDWFQNVETKY